MSVAELATVLTVEDDPIVRMDLRLVLEDAGFRVCAVAGDGAEAVAFAKEHRPDVIVMDLGLPGLDGVEATRQIRRERDVPIVALTGHGRGNLVNRAMDAGAAAHVLKPFHALHLVETVTDSLRTHRDAVAAAARLAQRRAAIIREEQAHHQRMRAAGKRSTSWDWEHAMPHSFVLWYRMWAGG